MPAPTANLPIFGNVVTAEGRNAVLNDALRQLYGTANPEDRERAEDAADRADLAATNSQTSATASAASAAEALLSETQAALAALAAGAPIVIALTDPVPANGTVELLKLDVGLQVHEVVAGAWVLRGWLVGPTFDTVAQLLDSTAATLGATGQIVEGGGFRYEVVASGEHVTTAGGVKLVALAGLSLPYYARALEVDPSASNNSAALQKWADLGGGKLPAGDIAFASKINIPDHAQVIGQGARKTRLRPAVGTGGLVVSTGLDGTSTGDLGARLEGFTIVPTGGGSAEAIMIDFEHPDGTGGMQNASIRDVAVIGNMDSSPIMDRLGIGIRMEFTMKSVLDGLLVQGWGTGINLVQDAVLGVSGRPNANDIRGCKIRTCVVGLDLDGDDNSITGSTIEGNGTGVLFRAGKLNLFGNHFENNQGPRRQLHVLNGTIQSVSNFYSEGTTDLDLFFDSAYAGNSSSFGDTLNSGVKNLGSGRVDVISPVLTLTVAGTGRVFLVSGNTMRQVQGSANNATFLGHAAYDFQSVVRNTVGILEARGNGGVRIQRTDGVEMALFDGDKVLRLSRAGGAIRLTSPDGTRVRFLQLGNDGNLQVVTSV